MKSYRLGLHEKRDIVGNWDKPVWIRRSRHLFLHPHFCWVYKEKNGHAVLRWEVSWRKISGFQVHLGTWQLFVQWRRIAVKP